MMKGAKVGTKLHEAIYICRFLKNRTGSFKLLDKQWFIFHLDNKIHHFCEIYLCNFGSSIFECLKVYYFPGFYIQKGLVHSLLCSQRSLLISVVKCKKEILAESKTVSKGNVYDECFNRRNLPLVIKCSS